MSTCDFQPKKYTLDHSGNRIFPTTANTIDKTEYFKGEKLCVKETEILRTEYPFSCN